MGRGMECALGSQITQRTVAPLCESFQISFHGFYARTIPSIYLQQTMTQRGPIPGMLVDPKHDRALAQILSGMSGPQGMESDHQLPVITNYTSILVLYRLYLL